MENASLSQRSVKKMLFRAMSFIRYTALKKGSTQPSPSHHVSFFGFRQKIVKCGVGLHSLIRKCASVCIPRLFFRWDLEIDWAYPSYLVVEVVVDYIHHCVGWYHRPRTRFIVGTYQFQTWPSHFCIGSATNFLLVQVAFTQTIIYVEMS